MKIINKIINFLLGLILFLFPLFFVPFLYEPFDLGKRSFLMVFGFLVYILWGIKILLEKKINYRISSIFKISIVFLIILGLSTFISSPNKIYSLNSTFGLLSFIVIIFTYVLIKNLGLVKNLLYPLLASGAVLSLITLAAFLSKTNIPINFFSTIININTTTSFTGGLIPQTIFLLEMLPLSFLLVFSEFENKRLIKTIAASILGFFIIIGLGISIYLLTTSKAVLLPQQTAWSIALESLKNTRSAIIGLGPGQFINAFTSFKPMSFNLSEYWNVSFASSANWYFQLVTEIGLIGLAIYLFLATKVIKSGLSIINTAIIQRKLTINLAIFFSLLLNIVLQFFLPLNFFLLAMFFILLALFKEPNEKEKQLDLANLGKLTLLLFVPIVIIWGVIFFFVGKVNLAGYYFSQSLKLLNSNPVKAYDLQIKAIAVDQNQPIYRIQYSQTNFALANSLAAKKDLTDQDRATITQLIQQSIREAKSAVTIDQNNAASWENLAIIYRNLINFAQGADSWTIAAYQQALNLDPLNPALRIDFGGLYFGQKDWGKAINLFNQAVFIKPDLANAHYNLANALKEQGSLVEAKKEYEITVSLVKIDTADYQKVKNELEEVEKRLPTPTPIPKDNKQPTGDLSIPLVPTGGIEPPIDLQDEGPNIPPQP